MSHPPNITTVSVIVTTYGRPDSLGACLDGLRAQERAADEVVVVVHDSDLASAQVVARLTRGWSELRCVAVGSHGMVPAFNAGLAAARHEIVAFVDDDAVPLPDWLARLLDAFTADPRIAAVGGRDLIFSRRGVEHHGGFLESTRGSPRVGVVQWFGRQIGNHHIGSGVARDVDVLKGVNMSFRRRDVAAHGFDTRLRGVGSQLHSELSICLPLRGRGLRVVYDPAILVRHYPAPRGYGVAREDASIATIRDAVHNEALAVLDHGPPARRAAFAIWGVVVGTRSYPGLLMLALRLASGQRGSWAAFCGSQGGRLAAWKTHLTTRRPHLPSVTDHAEFVAHDPNNFLVRSAS